MAIYSDVFAASAHIADHFDQFNGRRISYGCANVHIFNSLMRVFDCMNTSDVDCGVSFTAQVMLDGIVRDAVITLYKLPDGRPELRERLLDK